MDKSRVKESESGDVAGLAGYIIFLQCPDAVFEMKYLQRANKDVDDPQTRYRTTNITAHRQGDQTRPTRFSDNKVQEKVVIPKLRPGQPRQKRTSRKTD